MLDFHCDETDDPGSRNLEVVCAETLKRGFQGRVVAGHCTAMHSYPNPYAAKVIQLVVESQVQVVANPSTTLCCKGATTPIQSAEASLGWTNCGPQGLRSVSGMTPVMVIV